MRKVSVHSKKFLTVALLTFYVTVHHKFKNLILWISKLTLLNNSLWYKLRVLDKEVFKTQISEKIDVSHSFIFFISIYLDSLVLASQNIWFNFVILKDFYTYFWGKDVIYKFLQFLCLLICAIYLQLFSAISWFMFIIHYS